MSLISQKQSAGNSMPTPQSDSGMTFTLIFTALVAALLGTVFGYFLMLWIEWGAILGGLLLAGSVLLFRPRNAKFQFFRLLMFILGLSLAGAGITDILNFPESNSDVVPGVLGGLVLGLVLARYIWGSGLQVSDRSAAELFKMDGLFLPVTLPVMGLVLVILSDYFSASAKPIVQVASFVILTAILMWQLYLIKHKGRKLTEGAVWISFLFLLVLVLYLLIELADQFSLPIKGFVAVFVFVYSTLVFWFHTNARCEIKSIKPMSFKFRVYKNFAGLGSIAGFVMLLTLYVFSLIQLDNNSSPTSLLANYEDYIKLKDKNFIQLMMSDVYYGHQMQNVRFDEKDTPAELMNKFVTDRWSFANTIEHYVEWDEGVSTGLGIFAVLDRDKMLIAYTNHESPAANAGYKRGDEIIITRDYDTGKNYVYIKKPTGIKIANKVHGVKHHVDTVIHKIIRQGGNNIGYLWLMDFNKAAVDQIRSSFQEFQKQRVEEIILDLRYNGGGHADAMLASLIAGQANSGKVYLKFVHTDKYRDQDSTVNFEKEQFSIPTKRLFVLTTDDTCSASELIINGLRPYLPVVTVGGKTCGKPFFMQPIVYGNYVYLSITGKSFNALNESNYEQGILPSCSVAESYNHAVGLPGDALLDAALYYQKNNACPENKS